MQIASKNRGLMGLYQDAPGMVDNLNIVYDADLGTLINKMIALDKSDHLLIGKGTYVLKGKVEFPDNYSLVGQGQNMFGGTVLIGDDAELVLGKNNYVGDIMLSGTIDIQKKGEAQFERVNDKRSGIVKHIDEADTIRVNGQLIKLITPHPFTIDSCDCCQFANYDEGRCMLSIALHMDNVQPLVNDINLKCPLFKFTEVPFKLTKDARNKIIYEMEHLRK